MTAPRPLKCQGPSRIIIGGLGLGSPHIQVSPFVLEVHLSPSLEIETSITEDPLPLSRPPPVQISVNVAGLAIRWSMDFREERSSRSSWREQGNILLNCVPQLCCLVSSPPPPLPVM